MRKNSVVQSIGVLVFILLMLQSCSVAYPAPGTDTIKKAMFGGTWTGNIPAPAFVEKLDMRGCMSAFLRDNADFYFSNVTQSEIKDYVNALRNNGFDVHGVAYVFSDVPTNNLTVDAYEAKKDSHTLIMSAYGARPDRFSVIHLFGLTAEEFKNLNCPTLEDEMTAMASKGQAVASWADTIRDEP